MKWDGVKLECSDAEVSSDYQHVLNTRPRFGRSVLRCRNPARAALVGGFSRLNGLLFRLIRIGSVNCGQRQANATTRTTGCSLNDGRGEYETKTLVMGRLGENAEPSAKADWMFYQPIVKPTPILPFGSNPKRARQSENIRWSSRTGPVNRLQATSQPRRVMPVGSKSDALGSEGTGQTRAGKAFAFTEGTAF